MNYVFFMMRTIMLYNDNLSALKLNKNPVFRKRSKYMASYNLYNLQHLRI